ncbi:MULTISPECIES: hypothetical protein [unclassified Streptomyces]|uniref:hypothetical protein n=1 Tax=Streptomyces sp. SYP-A7185 TaxID=3040076 RepID=UPI0038F72726
METVTEWIKRNAHVLVHRKPDEPLEDLRPLAPLVRDAKIVALGAAARQTRELSVVADRCVRLLVEGGDAVQAPAEWVHLSPVRLSCDVGEGCEGVGAVHWCR